MKYYIRINKTLVEVSEEVHEKYYSSLRKERYFMKDQKSTRKRKKSKTGEEVVLPGREVYLSDLAYQKLDWDRDADVEELIIRKEETEKLIKELKKLPEEEFRLIYDLFYEDLSVLEVSRRMGIPRKKVARLRDEILDKLKKRF